jgi:hypothetical protein
MFAKAKAFVANKWKSILGRGAKEGATEIAEEGVASAAGAATAKTAATVVAEEAAPKVAGSLIGRIVGGSLRFIGRAFMGTAGGVVGGAVPGAIEVAQGKPVTGTLSIGLGVGLGTVAGITAAVFSAPVWVGVAAVAGAGLLGDWAAHKIVKSIKGAKDKVVSGAKGAVEKAGETKDQALARLTPLYKEYAEKLKGLQVAGADKAEGAANDALEAGKSLYANLQEMGAKGFIATDVLKPKLEEVKTAYTNVLNGVANRLSGGDAAVTTDGQETAVTTAVTTGGRSTSETGTSAMSQASAFLKAQQDGTQTVASTDAVVTTKVDSTPKGPQSAVDEQIQAALRNVNLYADNTPEIPSDVRAAILNIDPKGLRYSVTTPGGMDITSMVPAVSKETIAEAQKDNVSKIVVQEMNDHSFRFTPVKTPGGDKSNELS